MTRMTKAEYESAARALWDEPTFQRRLVAEAHTHGWHVQHSRPITDRHGRTRTAITGNAGYPDLTLARRGHIVIAELKTETGTVSPAQRAWLEHLSGRPWPNLGPGHVDAATDGTGILGPYHPIIIALWRPRHWATITATLAAAR